MYIGILYDTTLHTTLHYYGKLCLTEVAVIFCSDFIGKIDFYIDGVVVCFQHGWFRYGQCWVLAGVTVSLLRALGVASRPVTCYEAAHHCSKPRQVDRAFTPQGELLDSATQDQIWCACCVV